MLRRGHRHRAPALPTGRLLSQLTAVQDLLSAVPTPRAGTRIQLIDSHRWTTPVSHLPARMLGEARIAREQYPAGYYRLEGVGGCEVYRLLAPLSVTVLRHRTPSGWRTWMVDDPLHWLGMGELVAQLKPGRILCAGLGLGLMLHHLVQRKDVEQITVVESEADIIELVSPSLPIDPRIALIHDDWATYLSERPQVDAILWDLAVGEQEETIPSLLQAARQAREYIPNAQLVRFGLRDQSLFRPS